MDYWSYSLRRKRILGQRDNERFDYARCNVVNAVKNYHRVTKLGAKFVAVGNWDLVLLAGRVTEYLPIIATIAVRHKVEC